MAEDDVRQVMIKGRLIGIVGLDDLFKKTAETHQGKTDEEIQNRLLAAISVKNYIPQSAREDYGRALLREYKIAQNIPVEQESVEGLIISVLGAGCTRCTELVFYFESKEQIDVWRVLHGSRDIPDWLRDEPSLAKTSLIR